MVITTYIVIAFQLALWTFVLFKFSESAPWRCGLAAVSVAASYCAGMANMSGAAFTYGLVAIVQIGYVAILAWMDADDLRKSKIPTNSVYDPMDLFNANDLYLVHDRYDMDFECEIYGLVRTMDEAEIIRGELIDEDPTHPECYAITPIHIKYIKNSNHIYNKAYGILQDDGTWIEHGRYLSATSDNFSVGNAILIHHITLPSADTTKEEAGQIAKAFVDRIPIQATNPKGDTTGENA